MQGLRSKIGRYKIERRTLRIGNGEAKELICMTHGHELRGWEIAGGIGGTGGKLGQL